MSYYSKNWFTFHLQALSGPYDLRSGVPVDATLEECVASLREPGIAEDLLEDRRRRARGRGGGAVRQRRPVAQGHAGGGEGQMSEWDAGGTRYSAIESKMTF